MNNDLISRDALKKACAEMVRTSNNSDFIPCPSWNNAMELIDNAPTVKFSLMPSDETKEDAYKRGYERGKIAGILKANTRPQGEWKLVADDKVNLKFIYRCSECGREVSIYNASRLTEIYPFCHCGAKMKGGKE